MVAVLAAAAYTPLRRFQRFFLTPCAADGPVPETELDLHVEPVDLPRFYAELHRAAGGAPLEELARASYGVDEWPIYLIGPTSTPRDATTLVVAGVHGNEISGSLAAPALLERLSGLPGPVAIHVLAPANPVGLAHGSRYNGEGCDVNRDFGEFRTVEAAAIRDAIERLRPRVVIALHEGPQPGVFVIGTQLAKPALLRASVEAAARRAIPLATENNLGLPLATPGAMSEGAFLTAAKGWIGLHSLGAHASARGVPLVTTEVPWSWPDLAQRIETQVEVSIAASRAAGTGNLHADAVAKMAR